MILFIKNIDIEGPETIGNFFTQKNFQSLIIDLSKGENFSKINFDELDAVIVLGGPMNVYEEEKYPFLKEEDVFIREVLKREIPYLGICLGSQLLAKAVDAKIGKSPEEEIGFSYVELTNEGQEDPLFANVNEKVFVFQWHGDMFEIPNAGTLLAQSKQCPHQAFKVGKNAYGLQFHIEITDKSINEWSNRYFDLENSESSVKKEQMLSEYVIQKQMFNKNAFRIYNNFLTIIQQKI